MAWCRNGLRGAGGKLHPTLYSLSLLILVSTTTQSDPLAIPSIPIIRVLLTPSSVPQGATPTFFCEVAGIPVPVISTWLKDGMPLSSYSDWRIRLASGKTILQIRQVSSQDAGVYRCLAEAGGLNLSSSARLRIIVPPVIHNTTNATAVVGGNATLTCQTRNHLFLRWWFNGSLVDYLPRFGTTGHGEQLTVKDVHKADHGWYVCQALNERFSVEERVHLFVLIPPQVISGPQKTFVPVSWTVTFPCVGSGQPNPSSVWLHDGEVIELENRPNIVIYSDHITIANVTLEDSGTYHCDLVSDAGAATSKGAALQVINATAVLTNTIVNVVWGSSANLYCSVAPSDTVKIQWSVNGAVVDTNLQARFVQLDNRHLDVHQVTYEDIHITCLVKISDGAMAAETFQLNVTAPLGAPTDVSVSISAEYVLVNWQWSGSNNFSLHVILYQADGIVDSQVVGFEADGTLLGPVSPNIDYKVVVEAISVVGNRLPSRPVHFTTNSVTTNLLLVEGVDGDPTIQTDLATSWIATRSPLFRSQHPTPVHHQQGRGSTERVVIAAAVSVVIVAVVIVLVLLVVFIKMRRLKKLNYECQTDTKSTKDLEIADIQK